MPNILGGGSAAPCYPGSPNYPGCASSVVNDSGNIGGGNSTGYPGSSTGSNSGYPGGTTGGTSTGYPGGTTGSTNTGSTTGTTGGTNTGTNTSYPGGTTGGSNTGSNSGYPGGNTGSNSGYPGGAWQAQACDVNGNALTNNNTPDPNGYLPMNITQTITASETYPADSDVPSNTSIAFTPNHVSNPAAFNSGGSMVTNYPGGAYPGNVFAGNGLTVKFEAECYGQTNMIAATQ